MTVLYHFGLVLGTVLIFDALLDYLEYWMRK